MTADPYTRRLDPTAGAASTPQATVPLSAATDSDWISVTRLPHGVARVRTRRAEQALVVHVTGGGEPRPGDWGEVEADGVFALRAGAGYAFTATFDGPDTSSRLQTNLVHGVMAVHGFHRFIDGSGRRDYFTREFYVPPGGREDGEPETAADGGLPPASLTGVNDPSGLVGVWTVLDQANMNISALDCTAVGGVLGVRAYGPETDGAADWGTAETHLYADAARPDGPPTFLATFELSNRRVDLQVRNYNGILVGAQYTTFTDGSGRPDYFTRDCFRR